MGEKRHNFSLKKSGWGNQLIFKDSKTFRDTALYT